jgi:hypothetical protein
MVAGRPLPTRPLTAQQSAVGRQLGTQLAVELARNIRLMGLPAATTRDQPVPRVGDLVITGYFTLVEEGMEAGRGGGFGTVPARLETHAEGYWMTQQGLQRVGPGSVATGTTVGSGSSVATGGGATAAPLAVAVLVANPPGGVVATGATAYRYQAGEATVETAAKRTADEIAAKFRPKFEEQGWIPANR